MSEPLVVVLIAALVIGVIALPLLRGRGGASRPRTNQRDVPDTPQVPDELAELEMDRAMGRLTEADYLALKERVTATTHAAPPPAAKAPDQAPPPVAAAATAAADLDAKAEAMIAAFRAQPRPTCGTCGDRPEPGATYCSTCGTRLGTCPSCGRQPAQPGAQFCSHCGASLAA